MSFYSKAADLQKLNMAWDRVKKNRPACGVDNVTWEMFEESKKERLKQLNIRLNNHEYTTMPVRSVILEKEGKCRQVALYCMCDKVVQQSVAYELVKMYDGTFPDAVYAYRPGKSALSALEEISEKIRAENYGWALLLDIEQFFDRIRMPELTRILRQRIREEDVLELIRNICAAPELSETGELTEKRDGIHQGSALAPVLSNIYLSEFDWFLKKESRFYIRYSDDILILGEQRQQLEELLGKIRLKLEALGLALNPSKTRIGAVEEGFDFLGYHFDRRGKAIPAKAEANLLEKLETLWLTERNKPLQEKLKKGAEILGGWEQYFRDERKIASAYEFAAVAYMVWNKDSDLEKLAECRRGFRNINREICLYLYRFWEKSGNRQMMLYEMEDYQEVPGAGGSGKISGAYLEELLGIYEKLLAEETEESLVEAMQIYSDLGLFQTAMVFTDRISRLRAKQERQEGPAMVRVPGEDGNEEGTGPMRLTAEQLGKYMETFAGREDTYVVQELDKHGRICYEQRLEPLTEEVLKGHFSGKYTVGTYVQRGNSTAHFMVLDVDISKKALLEAGEDKERFRIALQQAAGQARKIQETLKQLGIYGLVEDSGHRGYHIWILFSEWVAVRYLNLLQDVLEDRMGEMPEGVSVEFFPNKCRVKGGKPGQAIKLPYGYHAKTGKQSRFLETDFAPVSDPGRFIMELGNCTPMALKKILNTVSPMKKVAVKENRVDEDISGFGYLPDQVEVVLKRCSLMRYLCQKAKATGYLSHFERQSVLYVFGHIGEDGKAFVHKVMEFTLNYQYSVTEKFISKLPAKPVSCLKLRDQYRKVTAEYGCSCNFSRTKNCYPSPVLHAIKSGEETGGVTLPTSRTLTKEKESKVAEELNINKRVQDITGKILELKKQKRGIDKNIARLEHELETIFNEAGIDCLEVEFGMLVRRRTAQGYEWVVEI